MDKHPDTCECDTCALEFLEFAQALDNVEIEVVEGKCPCNYCKKIDAHIGGVCEDMTCHICKE